MWVQLLQFLNGFKINVDIMTGEKLSNLGWTSLIGQFLHPVEMDGMG